MSAEHAGCVHKRRRSVIRRRHIRKQWRHRPRLPGNGKAVEAAGVAAATYLALVATLRVGVDTLDVVLHVQPLRFALGSWCQELTFM
jgi:hypothetical protein